jgi:hypothetical protein
MAIVWALICGATGLVIGHQLLAAAILMAPTISENTEVVKLAIETLESSENVLVAFFGLLGLVLGPIIAKQRRPIAEDLSKEMDEKVSTEVREAFDRLRKTNEHNIRVAIRSLSYRQGFLVALSFAACHVLAALIMGFIYPSLMNYLANGDQDALFARLFRNVILVQHLVLIVGCVLVSAIHYVRFLKLSRFHEYAFNFSRLIRVGGLGVFAVGAIALATLGPEQLALLVSRPRFSSIPGIEVNYLVFHSTTQLIIFPLLAILSCWTVRYFKRGEMRK